MERPIRWGIRLDLQRRGVIIGRGDLYAFFHRRKQWRYGNWVDGDILTDCLQTLQMIQERRMLTVLTARQQQQPTGSQCPHCGDTFSCASSMSRHVKVIHEKRYPFVCRFCGHGVADKTKLRVHLAKRHHFTTTTWTWSAIYWVVRPFVRRVFVVCSFQALVFVCNGCNRTRFRRRAVRLRCLWIEVDSSY